MELIAALALIFIVQVGFFFFAALFRTDKVTDLAYGLTFVLVSIVSLVLNYSIEKLALTLAITLWGLRLAGYLFIRIIKIKKDERFDGIRESFWRFAGFWLLQTIAVWVIMLPFLVFYGKAAVSYFYPGLVIWFIGAVIEAVADYQKFVFKAKNRHAFIQSGLWKYSRHPNYFGELLVWWGLFIYVSPALSGLEYLTVIGPLFLTILLLFVSGIPTVEKKALQKYGKEYREYMKKTSVLIPLWK